MGKDKKSTYNFLYDLGDNSLSFIDSNLCIFCNFLDGKSFFRGIICHFSRDIDQAFLLHQNRWVKGTCLFREHHVSKPWQLTAHRRILQLGPNKIRKGAHHPLHG